jgi:hypothetical protein
MQRSAAVQGMPVHLDPNVHFDHSGDGCRDSLQTTSNNLSRNGLHFDGKRFSRYGMDIA